MSTKCMQAVPAEPDNIALAAQLLQQGRLVAFPTETVYGLGADASNAEAVARIFTAKGRPADHPLIVHIADLAQLSVWARDIPASAYKLAEQFWPGPLAMVLQKQADVPFAVTGGQETVGIRMPQHPVALALLRAFNGGVAAPSANRFCRISPTAASHVVDELGDSVDMILDGGPCQVGVESTIVDLSTSHPRLLRPGHISVAALEAVLGTTVQLPPFSEAVEEPAIRAPGMLALHYAPTTPAILCPAAELCAMLLNLQAQGKRCAVLHYCQAAELSSWQGIQLAPVAESYAQGLYGALRSLDNLQLDIIVIEQPPTTMDWLAVNDRLAKATA